MGYRLTWKNDGDNTVFVDPKTYTSKNQVDKMADEKLREPGVLVTSITKEKAGLPEKIVDMRSNLHDGKAITAQGPFKEGTSVRLMMPVGDLEVYPGTRTLQTKGGFFLASKKDNSKILRAVPNGAVGYVVCEGAGFYSVKFPGVGVMFVPTYLLQPGDPAIDAIATILHRTIKAEAGKVEHFALGNGCVVKITSDGIVRSMNDKGELGMRGMLLIQFDNSKSQYRFSMRRTTTAARKMAQNLLDLTFFRYYGGTIPVP